MFQGEVVSGGSAKDRVEEAVERSRRPEDV